MKNLKSLNSIHYVFSSWKINRAKIRLKFQRQIILDLLKLILSMRNIHSLYHKTRLPSSCAVSANTYMTPICLFVK